MSQIRVLNVTFCYDGSFDNIFEDMSFSIDSNWKLGLIGRNGKGKTTFLKLLLGNYSFEGSIITNVCFDYFPYSIEEKEKDKQGIELCERIMPDFELWRVCRELDLLHVDAQILYRVYRSLSYGEQTKLMLALLFSKEGNFLLIDEPTNHLDMEARACVEEYLKQKKGFILVSHDRTLLDSCIDHVLVFQKDTIEVQNGNFSTWWENKEKQDKYELDENEKYKKEIKKLKQAAERTSKWAEAAEAAKIGYDPRKEDRFIGTRSYLGEKSRRMQQQRKNIERRQEAAMEEKSGLLKNLERNPELKLMPDTHYNERYVYCENLSLYYDDKRVMKIPAFEIKRGECTVIQGKNGSGKSSIIKAILKHENVIWLNRTSLDEKMILPKIEGRLEIPKGLKISYMNQDTAHLQGKLTEYIKGLGLEESLFKAILRQLDFERVQFEKNMEEYSDGQKKKVLLACSLLQKAHLYIWDEPLNFIDVFSRIQIEELIKKYSLTMLLVEHDKKFAENIADKTILL